MSRTSIYAGHSFHRWLQTTTGRRFVQTLVVLLTVQGWPLQELSRSYRWQFPVPVSLAWLRPVVTTLTQWIGQHDAEAHGSAARIFTIAPSCANPGDAVVITGNGFGAHNVRIFVGGQETGHGVITGGIPAQVVSATGNRATFIVPATATPGVNIVWAVNPGNHAGSIAFRVKQAEICGNQTDEDCDGQINDVDVCQPVNHPPVSNAGPDQTHTVGTTVQLDGTQSSDPDGQLLTFAWTLVSKPTSSTATLTDPTSPAPTFTIDVAGDYIAQLTVSDGLLSSTDTVTISTSNSAPIADAGNDTGGQVGTTITLDGSGSSDSDGNALTYQWTLVSKPATSSATLTDPTSVTPSFAIDVFGDYVVQLIVNDGTVNSAADTVTISTLNSPPVAHAGADQSTHVNETVTLDGTGSSDVDGNSLTYRWSLVSKPADSTASLTNATTPTPSLLIDRAGNYVVQLIVNDGIASSPVDTVTISTLNSKPVAHAGADQSGTVGTVIHLDGSSSFDVDGDPLTYQWSLTSRPATSTATLQHPTTVNPQFTLDKPGTYVVQLIVNDGTVDSDPVTVTITTLNSKPVAQAGGDQSHQVGTIVTLNGTASSDVDGDTLTFLWSLTSKPTGSTATLSDPSAVQPTFVIDKPGNYTAQLIVNDGTINSDPATVTISTVNSKPIAHPGPDQHGVVGATITLNGNGSSDVDGDPLTYQWSLTSKPATSTATLQNATSASASFVLDKAGAYTAQLIVNDGTVNSEPVTVTITTLNSKPVADAGTDQEKLVGQTVQLNGAGSSDVDGNALTYFWSLTAKPENSIAALSNDSSVNPTFVPDLPGIYVVQLIVNDGQLDSDPDTVIITVTQPDTTPPPPANLGNITVSPITNGQVTITGSANSVEGGATVTLTNLRTNQSVTATASATGSFTAQLAVQNGDGIRLIVTDSAGNASQPATLTVEPPLPPDPATVAPPVDRTVATTVADSTAFLYTGPNPIQTGVAPGTIEAKRAAVIRGKVLKKDNTPLSGVTITVLNHPELGQTLSRADGLFDMAVNGGGLLTVNYSKPGYLPAQRQIDAPWQDYAFLPDVVLIQPDPQVTTIDLTSSTPIQVAAGSSVTDSSGTRQAVVMIPQGTTATMVMPNGTTQPLTSLNLRLTEYTVNTNGPQTMPGPLPPTSAYTYAVGITADEALAAGAYEVRLNQSVPVYVDNFLSFPAGENIPLGAYDQRQAAWIPSPNGRVITVLSINGGIAQIDSNGDNVADDAATLTVLGITPAEQQQLAQRYGSGRSLWRLALTYFTTWDANWPGGPPADAVAPNGRDLNDASLGNDGAAFLDDASTGDGTGIAYQNQSLGRTLDLVGVPTRLHYQSDRTRGRAGMYTISIPISGATVPASTREIRTTVTVAGQRVTQSFPPQPNLLLPFTWNGLDAYGRLVQGAKPIEVTIEFVYPVVYQRAGSLVQAFGQLSGVPVSNGSSRSEAEIIAGRTWSGTIGRWDAREAGMGGWSLDIQHAYDPIERTLYKGDGSQRSSDETSSGNLAQGLTTAAGGGSNFVIGTTGVPATTVGFDGPQGLATGPDGSLYITDWPRNRIVRVTANGLATVLVSATTPIAGGLRHGQELSYRLRARKKRIVPIAMKLTGFDIERLKLIVGDL
ncbi:MAG: hypothetical protein FJ147_13550 [Deltaproteobacteria bacterium]|nr:hypothetical protein [Deltaproteobacteria bacterium]